MKKTMVGKKEREKDRERVGGARKEGGALDAENLERER